ncbi:cytochrome b/b6 domain-containing protein [Allorhizobium undicola]|uniref:cytochrome b/b6 domain-containing protein n=1 Tax=Allorhizobium undicola TaxID=78527 RepID=UPI000481D721|nr:cytochrome b/b6 domain-containing protein [Allorhizobium undicola]
MEARVKVWDPFVRLFHWGLVAAIIIAWFSADGVRNLHEFAGYMAAGLIVLRLALGLMGSRYARFRQFIRSPRHVLAYVRDVLRHRERRYLGHNPLGALMVVFLLAIVSCIALTGYLQTTDAFWGVEWVEELHEGLVNVLLLSVLVHVGGVVHASLRHRENLVAAMVVGSKRKPDNSDID